MRPPFPTAVFEKGFWFYVYLSAFLLSTAGSAVLYLAALDKIRGMERRSLLVMLWTSATASRALRCLWRWIPSPVRGTAGTGDPGRSGTGAGRSFRQFPGHPHDGH